ncbi:MAG TPA: biopolymer transporter ExbD [Chitinophagales bacterium]|nr:biopolymer transporter ExbD [Chitinophagales bacterium]
MPKVSIPKKTIFIDMTPMVDMAFLLVTFFMLTTQFSPDEPVKVETPGSISQFKVPDMNKTTITVADDGRVFFDFGGKYNRASLIKQMSNRYELNFTQDEINTYAILGMTGVPMAEMRTYLNTAPERRKDYPQGGVPIDSTNNELSYWLLISRAVNPEAIIIINADQVAQYGVVKRVIATLQEQNINRFALITKEKTNPNAPKS